MHDLDIRIFHWINGWSSQWDPFYVFFSEGTKGLAMRIGIGAILMLLIAAGPTTRRAALITIASVALANTFSDGLKHLFHMLRPCVELQDVTLRVGLLDSYGTASSHSANMAAVAAVLCYYFKWWGTPWVLLALLTGLSRIFVGVHYPSQVLLGYVCGALSALIVIKTWEAFVKLRRSKEPMSGTS